MRRCYFMKRLPPKIKCLIIGALLISTYVIVSYIWIEASFYIKGRWPSDVSPRSALKIPNVIVHLDMKGSPPKLSYLISLLPKLQELGVTGLLMEYEDMFPYGGLLANISARSCYKKTKLKDFINTAIQLKFDIIPLVQTFGHMEHVLKLAEFQHLREASISPDSICPSQSESQALIEQMLKQVVKFHQNIFPLKYIHIGCDEVMNLNKCEQCTKRKLTNSDLYLDHLKFVRDVVKNINPDIAVLAWDDMLRDMPTIIWETLDSQIEPVYWDYTPNLKVSHINLMHYHNKFKKIWIASSFKGADGRAATYPNMKKRFSNHFNWLNLILDYKFGGETEIYTFEGIILTGWSRYSHMDPLCELLPTSLPSLYLNLLLIKKYKEGVKKNEIYDDKFFYDKYFRKSFAKYLHCTNFISLDNFDISQCFFEGNDLYRSLMKWDLLNTNILNTINNYYSDMFGLDFLYKNEYVNMARLKLCTDWCYNSLTEMISIKKELSQTMSQYYDTNVIDEYINFKSSKTKRIVEEILVDLKNKSTFHTWKRRP